MKKTELLNYRLKLFRDALSWGKPARIPFSANVQNWMLLDAKIPIVDAGFDYNLCEVAARRFAEEYPNVDQMNRFGLIIRNKLSFLEVLCATPEDRIWRIGGNDGDSINAIIENEMIHADEYDELIDDYYKIIWEKALFRTYPAAKNLTPQKIVEIVYEYKKFIDKQADINTILRNEYGVAHPTKQIGGSFFIETLMGSYRGLKGLSIDLRRQPEKVYEICKMKDEVSISKFISTLKANPGKDLEQPYDVSMGCLAHTLMSAKQYERFYGESMRQYLSACEQYDKQVWYNTEGDFMRFGDYFNEYKRGVVMTMVEMDDPFEVRKKYSNIGISGGISVDVMGKGTPQQCIDAAKKAIDELGADGGFVLMPNKFVTYKYDMNADNLKAVSDFVCEYK